MDSQKRALKIKRLIDMLRQGRVTVREISDELDMDSPNVHFMLKELKTKRGLDVRSEIDGPRNRYWLA